MLLISLARFRDPTYEPFGNRNHFLADYFKTKSGYAVCVGCSGNPTAKPR